MSPSSADDLSAILDITIESMETLVTEVDADYELPSYLWLFWESKKFAYEKWRGLDADALYDEVSKIILERKPDTVCLVTIGWASVPSFPGRPSEDPQRAEAINFVALHRTMKVAAAMMKLKYRQGHRQVRHIIRTDELAGTQIEKLRTAMMVAHLHNSN